MKNKAISVQARAEQIVKEHTQVPGRKPNGEVDYSQTYNTLNTAGMTFDEAMRRIFSDYGIKKEALSTPGLCDVLVEEVQKAMQPNESEYVLTERFPRL